LPLILTVNAFPPFKINAVHNAVENVSASFSISKNSSKLISSPESTLRVNKSIFC